MNDEIRSQHTSVLRQVREALLVSYCLQSRLLQMPARLPSESRIWLLEELTAIRYLSNGLVLELCKLDDGGRSNSLHSIKKAVFRGSFPESVKSGITRSLKVYRDGINSLKTQHRNAYIAHQDTSSYPSLFHVIDFEQVFRPALRLLLAAFDAMWGQTESFLYEVGSQELPIDLRREAHL